MDKLENCKEIHYYSILHRWAYNWSSEIHSFAPELTVRMVTGTAAERRMALTEAGTEDILLTSYDLLKRDISEYEKVSVPV